MNKICKCKVDKCINCDLDSAGKCKTCQTGYIFDSVLLNCACNDNNCSICNDTDGT